LKKNEKYYGIEQVRVIQVNMIFLSKFGVRVVQVCVLYSNFYSTEFRCASRAKYATYNCFVVFVVTLSSCVSVDSRFFPTY